MRYSVKFPLPLIFAIAITIALTLNIPLAQSANLTGVSVVMQILKITPTGRMRRSIKVPL